MPEIYIASGMIRVTQIFERLKRSFAVPTDNPELLLAQMRAFSKQIPLLYIILIANTGFVAVTHLKFAPLWLTIYLPAIFFCIAIIRLVGWWNMRHANISPKQVARRLKGTIVLCGIFGLGLTAWSLALYPYGGVLEKAHLAFFMSVTMVACVFCLMHLRAAAFVLALFVTVPFVVHFALQGIPVFYAIAGNMVLVAGAMLYIVMKHSGEFSTMVSQTIILEKTNRETRRLSDENFRLANLDTLTNLQNRRSFITAVDGSIEKATAKHSEFALGLIDLDGFKAVNDLYGHAAGDALLVEAGRRLSQVAGTKLFVARLGGDEFGFISPNCTDLAQTGMAICESLRLPFALGEIIVEVSASCGIACFPDSSNTTTELLEFADYALYEAKSHSNGNAIIFSASHRDQLRASHQIDQALRHADFAHEMHLQYQPIINWVTGKICSVEALARWNSKILGPVSPTDFIMTAERSPLINKLTLALLQQLLTDMPKWPLHIKVSFNLSARNLASPDAMLKIVAMVSKSGIDPCRLEFEVTETALMINFDTALRGLDLLRNLGCTIALDDFGTGYSSLSYVHRLPLDKLKIDQRFVQDVINDTKAQNIIKTIVGLSQDLNLQCVAEGVETREQAEFLSGIGCSLMQGYYFAKPDVPNYIASLIEKNNPATSKSDRA